MPPFLSQIQASPMHTVVCLYARALASQGPWNWAEINAPILGRFGDDGLADVQRQAAELVKSGQVKPFPTEKEIKSFIKRINTPPEAVETEDMSDGE